MDVSNGWDGTESEDKHSKNKTRSGDELERVSLRR
jgi:hypothetical protein